MDSNFNPEDELVGSPPEQELLMARDTRREVDFLRPTRANICPFEQMRAARYRAVMRAIENSGKFSATCACSSQGIFQAMRDCFDDGGSWQDAMDQGTRERHE